MNQLNYTIYWKKTCNYFFVEKCHIHFVSLSKSWWGSYVPVLEGEMIFLDKIKEIFGADRDHIKLIRHVKRVISEKDLEINRERENEFLNNDR